MGRPVLKEARLVSVDHGNDAIKGAMLHAHNPVLCTRRIATAYVPARDIRAGVGVTTWQVNDSEPFWIGEDALATQKAESLPIGLTEERLPDQRSQHFLVACLIELLIEAGYYHRAAEAQGVYDLSLSLGVPNEEVSLTGIKDSARRTLLALYNTPYNVRRIDEEGKHSTWEIRLVEITPYPQSFGSFAAWYYTLEGSPIETDVIRHVTLDIGGGQLHDCQVDLLHQEQGRPKLRMSASLLGEGTIAIARAVRASICARYSGVHLSDTQAQQVLRTGIVTIGGRRTPVDDLVSEVIAARSRNLLTLMLPLLQEGQSFVMFTGGGSILLARSLHDLVSSQRSAQSFLFIRRDLASVLNAIGGYLLAHSTAQRVVEKLRLSRQN